MTYAIEMLNITKDFPGIRANDNITLQVEENTVHALLGENGAGKSTLMSILFGLYQPTSGVIKVKGKEVKITNPNVANELGIGMVHQHFKLIDTFTVTENIILGLEPKGKFGTIDLEKAAKRVQELSELYGLSVDPYAKIESISVGMQQRVEILKMLYRNNDILIFDEPTAVLTPQEIQDLMKIMDNLIKEGKTILLITHKLKEIKAIANRCTVIRKGVGIATIDVACTSEQEMAEMMVGRHVNFDIEKNPFQPEDVVLRIKNLSIENYKGIDVVDNFSLDVRAGEIVGLAGIDGNGQTELVYALAGMMPIKKGTIEIYGARLNDKSIKERFKMGLSHIPEDRHKHGLVLDFLLKENFVIHRYQDKEFSKHGFINFKRVEEYADRLIQEFDVRSGQGKNSITRSMSGGNQQKAIIARELDEAGDVIVIVQPTRGLDVGAIEYIHSRILMERDKGKAVLLVSLELEEILKLSDRIAVIHNGHISGLVYRDDTDENEIGLMMSGAISRVGGEKHEKNECI